MLRKVQAKVEQGVSLDVLLYNTILGGYGQDDKAIYTTVDYLLKAGANPEFSNHYGAFPLYTCLRYKRFELVPLLIAYGANVSRTYQGETLGDWASYHYQHKSYREQIRYILNTKQLPRKRWYKIRWSTQFELLALSTALGYKKNKQGICHAVKMMGIATLLDEGGLAVMKQRLDRIYSMSVEKHADNIKAAKKRRHALFLTAKQKYIKRYRHIDDSAIEELLAEYDQTYVVIINKKRKQLRNNKDAQKAYLDYLALSKTYIRNKFISIKANQDIDEQLSETEKLDLEIEAYLDGIEAHQAPNKIASHYFESYRAHKKIAGCFHNSDRDMACLKLTLPDNMQTKVAQLGHVTSGIYSHQEIIDYFRSLRKAIGEQPIVISISGALHAISVTYDVLHHRWVCLDVNEFFKNKLRLTYIKEGNEAALAKWLAKALFSDEDHDLAFAANFYTNSQYATNAYHALQHWKDTDTYKRLHEVTPTRVARKAKPGTNERSWLDIAEREEERETVKQIKAVGQLSKRTQLSLGLGAIDCLSVFTLGVLLVIPPSFLGGPVGVAIGATLISAAVIGGIALGVWAGYKYAQKRKASKPNYIPAIANPVETNESFPRNKKPLSLTYSYLRDKLHCLPRGSDVASFDRSPVNTTAYKTQLATSDVASCEVSYTPKRGGV